MFSRASRGLGPAFFRGSRNDLPEVDSSSIRALYGPLTDDLKCCGSISGRISGNLPAARVLAWIEDAGTGRLIAATTPDKSGTYRLDGLPEGDFSIFASSEGQTSEFASDSSRIAVSVAETMSKNFELRSSGSEVRVHLLGTSVRLAGLPVELGSISQDLFLGVDGSPENISRVSVSGGGISFDSRSFANGLPSYSSVKVAGFGLTLQPDLPKGEYTLVIEGNNGVRQYLVGSLINR
jgi:hypothetical protein